MTVLATPLPRRGFDKWFAVGPPTVAAGFRLDLPSETRLVRGCGWAELRIGHAYACLCWR